MMVCCKQDYRASFKIKYALRQLDRALL